VGLVFFFLVIAPLIELVTAYEISRSTGWGPLIAWVVVAFVLGSLVVKWAGLSVGRRVSRALQDGRLPDAGTTDDLIKLVAGVLILLPGLISDVVGLALLLPPVRAGLRRWFRRRYFLTRLERRGHVVDTHSLER
jgi:UPF0716 protein FxsA